MAGPAVKRTPLGLTLLLVTAVLAPVDFRLGSSAISVCVLFASFLCGLWLLRMGIVRRRVAVDRSRAVLSVLVFMAVAVLSFLVGQYPWFRIERAPMSAQVAGLMLFLLSGGIFLLAAHELRSLAQLRYLTRVFIGAGAGALVTMLIPGLDIHVGSVAVTSHGSVGSLFFVWVVAITVGQALWNNTLSRLTRFVLLAVAGVALLRGLFVTFSWASGWLPPLVTLGTMLLLRFPRIVLASGLLLTTPALLVSARAWEAMMVNESWSWMTRLEILGVMRDVIARNPWLGLGPANYHFYTRLFTILGFRRRFNSHNNYVDLLAQTGVVGLFAFCWFVFELTRLAFRLYSRLPNGFGRGYAAGALGGLAGSLVAGLLADWIVPFVYNIGLVGFRSSLLFWFLLGGLHALGRLTAPANAPLASTADRRPRGLALTRA